MAWKEFKKKYDKYKAGEKSRLAESLEKEKLRAEIRKYRQTNKPKPGSSGGGFFGGIGFDPTGQSGRGIKRPIPTTQPVKVVKKKKPKRKRTKTKIIYVN